MKNVKKLVLSLVLGTLFLGATATTLVLTSDLYQNNRTHHRNKQMTTEEILEKASTIKSELSKIRTKFYTEKSFGILVELDFTVELLFNINKENSKYENKEKLTKEQYESFKKLQVKFIRSLKTSKALFGEISDRDLLHNLFFEVKLIVYLINNSEIVIEDEKITEEQPEKIKTIKEVVKNSENTQKGESEKTKLEDYKKLYSNYINIFNSWINKIKKNKLETELPEVLKSLKTKKELLQNILNNKLSEVIEDENSLITHQELQSFKTAVI